MVGLEEGKDGQIRADKELVEVNGGFGLGRFWFPGEVGVVFEHVLYFLINLITGIKLKREIASLVQIRNGKLIFPHRQKNKIRGGNDFHS